MVEAIIFWVLAVYGAFVIVIQCVRTLRRGERASSASFAVVLIVQNAERGIESALRMLLWNTSFGQRPDLVIVADVDSIDGTGFIIRKLASEHELIEYRRVSDEGELPTLLADVCVGTGRIGCIMDLRDAGALRALAQSSFWHAQSF